MSLTLTPFRRRLLQGSILSLLPWVAGFAWVSPSRSAPAHSGLSATYARGLEAWRKAGAINNHAACASCHGPDGLEIATYGFDDATLLRRAAPHLGRDDAEAIVGLIHAVREKYHIEKLLDPMKDRPLQPGGEVLPGATPAERDAALGVELGPLLPTLAQGKISSLAQAKQAKDELLKLDPWNLRIGVPFSRISEDFFHGPEHASINQWFPDIERDLKDEDRATYFDLEDEYLAEPTDDHLYALLDAIDKDVDVRQPTPAEQMSMAKYKALLIEQHLERQKLLGLAPNPHPAVLFGARKEKLLANPMWKVGDIARLYSGEELTTLGFPPDVIAKKTGGPSLDDQMKSLRDTWLWLGWLTDQGLQRISFDRQLQSGQYMSLVYWQDGPYPMHNAFFIDKKLIVESYVPEAWNSTSPQHFVLDFSGFMRNGKHMILEPKDPEAKQRYRTFVANSFRMAMYLLLDELQRTHISWGKDANKGHIRSMTEYLNMVDPAEKAEHDAFAKKLIRAVDDSTQRLPGSAVF